jgi:hypothetical protein
MRNSMNKEEPAPSPIQSSHKQAMRDFENTFGYMIVILTILFLIYVAIRALINYF